MKTYSLSMIGCSVFAILFALVVFYESARESLDPEFGLSTIQYRKSIDFDYFVDHLNSDREWDKSPKENPQKVDDATLQKKWEAYKVFSRQTAKRDADKGLSSTAVSLALLGLNLLGHIVLYRKSRARIVA